MKKRATTIAIGTLAFIGMFHVLSVALDKATDYECHGVTVTVNPGDTVWGIASEWCEGHTGFATSAIVDTYGATIHPGQTITLP